MKMHSINRSRSDQRSRRGVAMLLVMLALLVCMVLVTGYLSGQGTGNGIAKNEMEYVRAQRAAEAGVNLCMSQIKNVSNWRATMTPGTWLNNMTIGSATVTVTAADSAGNASFLTNPTNAIVLTSTATYNGRSARLVATAQPTGGGTVFYNGSFTTGTIRLQGTSMADSFNSLNGVYSATNSAANALFSTASSVVGAIDLDDSSSLVGSILGGLGSILNSLVDQTSTVPFVGTVAAATETRTAGDVIPINSTALTTRSQTTYVGTVPTGIASGVYTSLSVNNTVPATNVTMGSSTIRVTGNMTVNTGAKLTVPANTNLVIQVDGNLTYSGTLTMGSGSTVTFYVGGNFTASGAQMNYNSGAGGTPANLTVFGQKNAGSFSFRNATYFYGSVYAPSSDITMQETSQIFGGVIGKSLNLQNSAKLHWDTALRSKSITNVTAGSASPGTPVYIISYQWNPGSN
jgi:Tfp pilus assembly protein PilX